MLRIIDCFIFYNELDLLTYRLNILDTVVDYFVIVESTHTFTGKEKILYYNEHKHLFEKFKDKIIHIIVDDIPYKNIINFHKEQWENEYFQRNAISRGIQCIDNLQSDDVILIADIDEIPDPTTLGKIKEGTITVTKNALEMDLYYYNIHSRLLLDWDASKIISYKEYKESNKTCTDIRKSIYPRIAKGGWHLSYFGDASFIKNKINTFSHQELNIDKYTNVQTIQERINKSVDLFGRNIKIENLPIADNKYLPFGYDIYLTNYFTL
jgi:beta-1,4-mannosyl-glycoprotein beta-1,4-N-acetylglucosaminyltransferase